VRPARQECTPATLQPNDDDEHDEENDEEDDDDYDAGHHFLSTNLHN
jgi:hypothetical protein